jgi:thiol-disulfide isomerase/thioredoxin
MRTLFTVMLAAFFLGCAPAQDKPASKAKLKVGDAAPAWNVTTWMNGAEVKGYDKDKVYVVEFWATWCGPCIKAMPHLAELQAEHKKDGLVVIGMTTKDENNTADAVKKFVDERGPKLGYVFAFCDNTKTDEAFMQAAQQDGIPCSFVVGKDGKIAYIGHPMNLDDVLPKVLAGTWKGQADVDALDKMVEEFEKVFEGADKKPEASLDKLEAFGKKYPEKIKHDDVQGQKLSLLVATGKYDDAKAIAVDMIAKSEKKKSALPALYAIALANKTTNPKLVHGDVVEKALELAMQYEDSDVQLHLAATEAYMNLGKKAKALELGAKAVKLAPNDKARKQVQKIVDQITGDEK